VVKKEKKMEKGSHFFKNPMGLCLLLLAPLQIAAIFGFLTKNHFCY